MEEWSDGVVFVAGATLLTISLCCLSYVIALYVQVARDSAWIASFLLGDVSAAGCQPTQSFGSLSPFLLLTAVIPLALGLFYVTADAILY